MTNNRLSQLLQQFADNTISKPDYEELIAYLKQTGNDHQLLAGMDRVWDNIDRDALDVEPRIVDNAYQKLLAQDAFHQKPGITRQLKFWYKAAAAAVVVAGLGIGIYIHSKTNQPASIAIRYKNDVAPGSNKAILTLANGQKIDLTNTQNGDLARQSAVRIIKTGTGQLVYQFNDGSGNTAAAAPTNTITTPKGGQYQVVLPDGSKVWLNTASSLQFPVAFNSHERRVQLNGEAYFEVAKNAKKPFRVVSKNQVVEVLGTHFNIQNYADENSVHTTLAEGSVKVSLFTDNPNNLNHSLIIKPGQQAVLRNSRLLVSPADMEEALAWKNGLFLYNNQTLENIMKQVSRWYDVDVTFTDEDLKTQVFSGSLSRFKNISELLEVLETTGSVHFKIEGRRVTAMK